MLVAIPAVTIHGDRLLPNSSVRVSSRLTPDKGVDQGLSFGSGVYFVEDDGTVSITIRTRSLTKGVAGSAHIWLRDGESEHQQDQPIKNSVGASMETTIHLP